MDNHTHNVYYLIDDSVEFWPAINMLISCSSREQFNLHYPAAYCLLTLIRNKPRIVTQRELIEIAWGERSAHVTANTFYQSILNLRKVLKEAGLEHEIVQTIPRRGLRIPDYVCITEAMNEDALVANASTEELKSESLPKIKDEKQNVLSVEIKKMVFNINDIITFGCIVVMILISTILFLNVKDKMEKMTILNSYQNSKISLFKDCKIYWNDNAVVFSNHEKFLNYIRPNCTELTQVYISTYLRSTQASILQCRITGMINENKYCTSSFYVR